MADRQPDQVDELVLRAQRLLDAAKLDEAQAAFEEVLAHDPSSAVAHNKRGVCLAYKGIMDEAEQEFLKAVELDPEYAAPYSNLGCVFRERGELDKAIEYYRRAIAIDPLCAAAHQNLSSAYRKKGRFSDAVGEYKRSVHLREAQWRRSRRPIVAMRGSHRGRAPANLSPWVPGYSLLLVAAIIAVLALILRR